MNMKKLGWSVVFIGCVFIGLILISLPFKIVEQREEAEAIKTELAEAKALILEYQETDIDELKADLVEAQNEAHGLKFAEDALEEGQWYE